MYNGWNKEEYNDLLSNHKWIKTSDYIKNRDKNRCVNCGNEKNLHVHHITYVGRYKPWEYPPFMLVTLCKECHTEIHMLMKHNTPQDIPNNIFFVEKPVEKPVEKLVNYSDIIDDIVHIIIKYCYDDDTYKYKNIYDRVDTYFTINKTHINQYNIKDHIKILKKQEDKILLNEEIYNDMLNFEEFQDIDNEDFYYDKSFEI